MNFYQLQTVSCYDFGESSISIPKYVELGKKYSYSGLAISDLSSLLAYSEFHSEMKKGGLLPIYGAMFNLEVSSSSFQVCFYVLNEEGYLNLISLVNLNKQSLNIEDLLGKSNGLAAVLKSEDAKMKDEAFLSSQTVVFAKISSMFDEFYFGIEIYSNSDQKEIEKLRSFAYEHSYKCLAFPKACYFDKKDSYKAFKILHAIHYKEKITCDELANDVSPYIFLSPKALSVLYKDEEIKEIENLVKSIDFNFTKKRGGILEISSSPDKELRDLAYAGLKKKIGVNLPKEYVERLNYELSVISQMKFSNYFLLVADYVNHFRNSNVKVGPGRGSGAGSLVSYALNIVEVDPIKYNLYFERFLNPLRKSMPDIDVDFDAERREDVISYLKQRYSPSKVSLIVTFSTLQMKAALSRISQVFEDIPSSKVQEISNLIKREAVAKGRSFKDELVQNRELVKKLKDPYYKSIVDLAILIEDFPIGLSTHASGVIISNVDLSEVVPLSYGITNIALYDYHTLEEMGFLKFDILALSNLSFIKQIETEAKKKGIELKDPKENLNDRNTYKLINDKLLIDLFQLGTYISQRAIEEIKVENFDDLIALISLIRPGANEYIRAYGMNKKPGANFSTGISILDEILKPTYGVIIYQEQILDIGKKIALFDGGKADILRRAISKKDEKLLISLKKEFFDGCQKNGLAYKDAEKIYKMVERFGQFGFNKSHACAYALILYTLAYYKANYPRVFYKVSLNKSSPGSKKFMDICFEIKRFSLDISSPSVNRSEVDTDFIDNDFYLGLKCISGMQSEANLKVIEDIVRLRKEKPYTSLNDFLLRVDLSSFNEKDMRSFISSGALDEFNYPRGELIASIDKIILAYKFNVNGSSDFLPELEKKEFNYSIEDFFNEIDSLGVCFSIKIASFLTKPRKYHSLFIVAETPRYFSNYSNRVKLELVSRYGRESLMLNVPREYNLKKGDIVSVSKVETAPNYINVYINKEVNYV